MTSLKLKEILARKAAEKAASEAKPKDNVEVDNLLDTMSLGSSSDDVFDNMSLDDLDSEGSASKQELIPITLLEGEIDPRIKLLSHSSRTMLHGCPRKFQLYRLNAERQVDDTDSKEIESKVTFAFGHAVGIGIQSVLEGKDEDTIYMDTFVGWDYDLLENTPRQCKSFWYAMHAVDRLMALRDEGFLDEYELVYYEGKPAIELSFIIHLPNGYKYRGFVDAVLRHKATGEIIVLECKTSSGRAEAATYKNSGQAVGYSVVLDIMFPELSSYKVIYLVYETKSFDYVQLDFNKSLLQRALWLQELLLDCKVIDMYEEFDSYPLHGEHCYSFFKDCEYLSTCTMSTQNLTKPLTQQWLDEAAEAEAEYQFSVTFEELVQKQIEKGDI